MRSSLRYLIAGALAAGLVAPAIAAGAPNDLDRSFGDRGTIVHDRPGFASGEIDDSLGVQRLRDGGSAVAFTTRCESMGCYSFGLSRFSPDGSVVPLPDAWRRLPFHNDYDGMSSPDRLTGWRALDDGGLELTYVGGDPASWDSPGPIRGLPADAPAGPFAYLLPADADRGAITPLPWSFAVADGMTDGGRVGLAPEGWIGLLDAEWKPAAGFGPEGRLKPPDGLGTVMGIAGGDAVRVGGADDGGLRLWRIAPGPGGWVGTVSEVPTPTPRAVRWSPGVTGTVDVAPGGGAVVARTRWTHGGAATTDIAMFNPDGTPDRRFGTRGLLRVAGAWVSRIQANGKVVLAASPSGGAKNIRVRRVNADGSPDPSFPVTAISMRGKLPNQGWSAGIDARGRILVTQGLAEKDRLTPAGFMLARLRGGEAPALRLTSPRRPRANVVRLTATASVAGRARIAVRQSGRVVGVTNVRFTRGSRQKVTVRLRGASKGPMTVRATLRGTRATGATRVPAAG